MSKAKGDPKSGGRQKGTPNKVNADLRAMIIGALDAKGGQEYLEKQADANPVAFMGLVGKLLPKDVNATHTIKHDPAELTDGELAAIIRGAARGGNGDAATPASPPEPSKLH